MRQSRSCLNRADLLAVLELEQPAIAGFLAKQLRLEANQEDIIKIEPISTAFGLSSKVDLETNWQPSPTQSQLNALFWVVERSEMRETTHNPSEPATSQLAVPQWRGRPSQKPKFYPLASPRYLLPRLFQHLKHQRHSREIDMQRIVKKVSKGEYLYQLPRRQRRSLGRHLHIIEDHHLHLVPYWLDQSLYTQVLQARLPDYAYSHEVVQEGQSFIEATIPENSVVLVFSDLGALADQPYESISFWWQVGKVYERLGCKLIAITPCHAEACDERLRELFEIVSWQPTRHMAKTDKANLRAQADELLTLLAPVIRLEPALLRSVRLALAQHGFKFPIEVEAAVWQHVEVIEPSSVAATLNSDGRKQRLEQFKHYPDAVKQTVLDLIREWRAPLAEQVWYEEMISLDEGSRALVPETDWQDAEGYLRYLDQQSELEDGLGSNTRAWFKRMSKRLPEPAWNNPNVGECLQRITGRLYADKDLPYAIDPQVLKPSSLPERVLRIYQQGQQLMLGQVVHPFLKMGGRLADIKYRRGLLYVEAGAFKQTFRFAEDEPAFQVLCELQGEGELVLRTDAETLYLGQMEKPEWASEIGRDEFGVYGDLEVPKSIYISYSMSDKQSLDLLVQGLNSQKVFTISDRGFKQGDSITSFIELLGSLDVFILIVTNNTFSSDYVRSEVDTAIKKKIPIIPILFDSVAKAFKPVPDIIHGDLVAWDGSVEDIRFQKLVRIIKEKQSKVTQRFRFIPAGSFVMGSLENDPNREANEMPHSVTLTHSFWLADTAVTQELWLALTGFNPSNFKMSNQLPVENVSWVDAQSFIHKLIQLNNSSFLSLPTEAQWEYSYRAGGSNMLHFDDYILKDKTEYNSNYRYKIKENVAYKGKTVIVKSLPSNRWGMYEMLGNVWEWCKDDYNDFLGYEGIVDPIFIEGINYSKIQNKVIRGGSWYEEVRVAQRSMAGSNSQSGAIGFRLCLNVNDKEYEDFVNYEHRYKNQSELEQNYSYWELDAYNSVLEMLEIAHADRKNRHIVFYDLDEKQRVKRVVSSQEDLMNFLIEIAENICSANAPKEDGDYLFDWDSYGIVEFALRSYPEISLFFDYN